jgi:hypothetical protein
MTRDPDNLADVQWVAQCAHRLRSHWPHADPRSLEEAALELWQTDWLREMSGRDAAELWLRPLASRDGAASEGDVAKKGGQSRADTT